MTPDQALELLNAIEDYGDAERTYGKYMHSPGDRDCVARRSLDDVRRLIRPHVDDPDHPILNDRLAP